MRTRVTDKGQVTIPKPLRDSLGIEPGDELEFAEAGGMLTARRVMRRDPLDALVGMVSERVDVDAYLAAARGPAWDPTADGGDE